MTESPSRCRSHRRSLAATGLCAVMSTSAFASTPPTYEPYPDKAAILFIGAHPDDEGIFFGGTQSYYPRSRNLPSISMTLTTGAFKDDHSGDYKDGQDKKIREFTEVVQRYGFRNKPVLPQFQQSNWRAPVKEGWENWSNGPQYKDQNDSVAIGKQRVSRYIAEQIRKFKPDVIVVHDKEGEYGHPDHKNAYSATIAAWDLAAGRSTSVTDDLGSTAVSAAGIAGDTWEAKKVYVHMWDKNQLFHDHLEVNSVDTNGDGVPDQTPRGQAEYGLDVITWGPKWTFDVSTVFRDNDNYGEDPSEWFGLHTTTVGLDTVQPSFTVPGDTTKTTYNGWARGDFLENIDLSQYAKYLADFNRDGKVGQDDLKVLQDNWLTSVAVGAGVLGDASGDGLVNAADFTLLQQGWSETANAPTHIPEPSSLALIGLGGLALVRRRRSA